MRNANADDAASGCRGRSNQSGRVIWDPSEILCLQFCWLSSEWACASKEVDHCKKAHVNAPKLELDQYESKKTIESFG